ncbi:unnamed protein product [Rotaria socialis]|uniref:Uncharacterized protein n=1 Tax=Rotaria socialis TaxID=392032 RepID=A0A817S4B9_9BILA|nr:unnamed protein product [Rotaria socialis]CAF4436665.1 unnamed protein product [Rotaria socialis]
MMKKGSVFAGKKGPMTTGYGTPVNISSASSSFFDNSLQQMSHNPLGGAPRNWQATPLSSHRFPAPHHPVQQPNSTTSIRTHPLAASVAVTNTPNSSMINRVKPYTLQGLVESLNEILAELGIPHSMRYDTKYGFEDILTVLDQLTNPSRYEAHRFQPFPPLPQPSKPGGKISLTDRWAYLKQVLLAYRLSNLDQLTRIKPERVMAHEHIMIMIELLIQLVTCVLKSQQEQERISTNNYLTEFKVLMRQMFWIGRHSPVVMEESMHELRHHIYAKDNLEVVDRLKHEKQMNEMTVERDQLKCECDQLKATRNELENDCTTLTTSNENDIIEFTRKQEESSDEQSKLMELTQIVEQKEMDKKHLTDRNQLLSDKLFSQQTDVELQRHIRSNNELKQQHEVLLSTLLLEQQLHTTASNEHKRLVKELQEWLGKYQILLSAYKHKAPRPPPTAVDFDLSDIIGDTTSNINNDSVKQAQIAIENLTKEIIAQEILLAQRHRDLEQESKQKIEELQSAEREWKSAAKHGQRRAAQQNELSRFQQEIRLIAIKVVDLERRTEEKKALTTELKKEFDRIKSGIIDLLSRFELLETNYVNKEEEVRTHLSWFMFDQTQLAKVFRRDVEELKRLQQEHLSKLDTNANLSSFDELLQQQVNKYYHYMNFDDDEEDEENENLNHKVKLVNELDKLHDDHVSWLKKKKKDLKTTAPIVERLQFGCGLKKQKLIMNDSDEDIDPLMGPVAELMAEHNLASTTTTTTTSDMQKTIQSIETLDQQINILDYLSFFNIHLLFRNIFNYILDTQWYNYMKRTFPKVEQDIFSNRTQMYSSLKRLLLLLLIYAISTLPLPYLFHIILIIDILYLFIIDFILPLYIYYNWFNCLKSIRLFLNTIQNHQQWLITIHGFQLIRPTSSLFENELYELRRRIFEELKKHFLYSRQTAQQYSIHNEQLICYIDLEEFGPLIIPTDEHDYNKITNYYDQTSINSLLKLCHLQINECIQLINLNRPKSYGIFYNYNKLLSKSILCLNKIKQNCSIMIDYIDNEKLSSKKLVSSYFLLRSNCEQLFDMNEKNSFNDEQLKRIIQDLKTVVYSLEGIQIKPKTSIEQSNNEETVSNDNHSSNISSYHRFDDEIKESTDEILVCDTGKLNDDELKENRLDIDDYDQKFLREQTNYLMKELQIAIQGKKQEWTEREQRLLGNVDNNNDNPVIHKEEEEEEDKKPIIDNESFEKLSSMPNTISMLDELKHTFVLNKKKLNTNEDVFGEEEEIFDDDDDDDD